MTTHHDHQVTTPVHETTVVSEGSGGSGGMIAGLIVALVVIGLVAWAIFGSGILNGATSPAGKTNQPTNPKIDVNINQPSNSGGAAQPSNPTGGSSQAPAGGANQAPAGGTNGR